MRLTLILPWFLDFHFMIYQHQRSPKNILETYTSWLVYQQYWTTSSSSVESTKDHLVNFISAELIMTCVRHLVNPTWTWVTNSSQQYPCADSFSIHVERYQLLIAWVILNHGKFANIYWSYILLYWVKQISLQYHIASTNHMPMLLLILIAQIQKSI